MSAQILLPLQTALFELLDGDAALGALVNGVFDFVPQSTAYPYVTIGDASSEDWSTASSSGADTRFTIQVFGRGGGRKQVLTIMARLHTLLDGVSLSLSGHHCVRCRHEASRIEQQADGLTYIGQTQFHLLSEQE